ncbi:adenylosuccinate synthetase [Parasphingorhabdus sp.]|uniref:adenylosuccinate synthetase n=1 Tax=Parasphingorhabdus sp. TaxID=2709688 RepID=UPI002F94DD9E
MPVSIVVGGQFGSEGKGKVALELVRTAKKTETQDVAVVRVGGPNSGHTGYNRSKKKFALRQLPAGCIDRNVDVVFPAGSYIDVDVLLAEIYQLDYPRERIFISPYANVITPEQKEWERKSNLGSSIGSTGSGVGAAVMASVARNAENFALHKHSAEDCEPLAEFIRDTSQLMRGWLSEDYRIIIEGSQGFGLSLLDGGYWPKATARGTTAASALAEAGLSPRDVDNVTLVLRSFPIRVAGDSGPLPHETTWDEIAEAASLGRNIQEFTTVTKKLRRVAAFDAELVRRAVAVNNPSHIVMNHLDYVGTQSDLDIGSSRLSRFVREVELLIDRKIDHFGFSEFNIQEVNRVSIE